VFGDRSKRKRGAPPSGRVFGSKTLAERIALGDGWLSVLTYAEFSRYNLIDSFARPMLRELQTKARGSPMVEEQSL
jgi:hypothetical protein